VTGPIIETRTLQTADGASIVADVALAPDDRGGVVLCHPHPLYGGSRFDAVIGAVWSRVLASGRSAVRFDFRREHDRGDAERLDVEAAMEVMGDRRVVLVGYSFGSYVCLRSDGKTVAGWVGIAPVLHDTEHRAGRDQRPTLLVVAGHDQFTPPARVAALTAGWSAVSTAELPGADHFLAGHLDQVAGAVCVFVDDVLG
jgi:hypothetical protein